MSLGDIVLQCLQALKFPRIPPALLAGRTSSPQGGTAWIEHEHQSRPKRASHHASRTSSSVRGGHALRISYTKVSGKVGGYGVAMKALQGGDAIAASCTGRGSEPGAQARRIGYDGCRCAH